MRETGMSTVDSSSVSTHFGDLEQLDRLLAIRTQLLEEQDRASSPAVARAIQTADCYLFLSLGYFGYADLLYPEQR